ncbi:hypothetical protein C4572_04030 [Candidatus Parcubacteria bacterium]|nr:MAG: hypothetical protein C4572_04030 [Candidatus Parcubacteria bacterium]
MRKLSGLIALVFVSLSSCASAQMNGDEGNLKAVVLSKEQPKAALAPERATVDFTYFKIRPPHKREWEIKKIEIERMGFGNLGAIDYIYLIADKSPGVSQGNYNRIVMNSNVTEADIKNNTVDLLNLPEDGGLPSFTKPVKLKIAARMKNDLIGFSGQVLYLTVKSIIVIDKKTGRELEITGKMPIVGVGNTVNSSLKIGGLEVERVDGGFNLRAGDAEPIRLTKWVIRTIGEENPPPDWENFYSCYVDKVERLYQFKREKNLIYAYFKEEILIEKGETVKFELRTGGAGSGSSNAFLPKGSWEVLSIYTEDIEAYGYYYGYRIMPGWAAKG